MCSGAHDTLHPVSTSSRNLASHGFGSRLLLPAAAAAALLAAAITTGTTRAYAQPQLCGDLDANGVIAATDALRLLQRAVGQQVVIQCPPCNGVTSTTMATSTTTMPQELPELIVSKTGTGTGLVESSPPGIQCGSSCRTSYALGTEVTLTAQPDPGSVFTGWAERCSGTGPCILIMSRDRRVTANFDLAVSDCPTTGPITDLRKNCSDRAYLYQSAVEGVALATDGSEIVLVVTDLVGSQAPLAVLGTVTGATTFIYDTICTLDDYGNVVECFGVDGSGNIANGGQRLNIVLDSNVYPYDFVDSIPLMTTMGLGRGYPSRLPAFGDVLRALRANGGAGSGG